jgi:tetratricopeptide (TPR) repeat protein
VVAVGGQAGVGKSTFVAEVIRSGGYQHHALSSVMSSTTQSISYFPFREILKNLHSGEGAVNLKTLDRSYRLELSKLVPELMRGDRAATGATMMVDKYRLFEGVKQALERAIRPAPRLLVLDNMQWADQGSLELLQYLGRTLKEKMVFMFLVYREEDLPNSPLQQALESLAREANYRDISLNPLSGSDVARMLVLMADAVPPPELISFINKQTGGNPFYVEEQMKALLEGGALAWQGRRLLFDRHRRVPIPDTVEGVAIQKMKRLDQEAQEVLELASVLGREADFGLMKEITSLPDGRLFHAMDGLLRLKLLVETEPERYYFPENLTREAIYGKLTSIKLRYYHQRVAQALLSLNRRHPGDVAEELSQHFFQAGEHQQALIYSLEAAERSRMVYANSEAIMYYSRALKCLQRQDAADRMNLEADCYIKRAEVGSFAGNNQQAITDLKRAMVRAREARHPGQEAEARLQLATVYNATGRFSEATRSAQEALNYYQKQKHRRGQILALTTMGSVYVHSNDYERAIECFRQGLETIRSSGDEGLAGRIYNNLGAVYSAIGTISMAEEHFNKAVIIAKEHSDLKLEAQALNNLALELINTGAIEEGLSHHQKALRIFQQIGSRRDEAICLNNIGLVYVSRSDFLRARNLLNRSLAISREILNQRDEANTLCNMGSISLELGESAAARDNLNQAMVLAEQIGVQRIKAHILDNLGSLDMVLGSHETAMQQITQALQIWKKLGNERGRAGSLITMGEVLLAAGNPGGAEDQFRSALEICGLYSLKPISAQSWLGLSEASVAGGNLDAARRYLDDFSRTGMAESCPDKRARGLQISGQIHLAAGESKKAEEELSLAAAIYAAAGMKFRLAQVKYHLGKAFSLSGKSGSSRRAWAESRKLFREIGAKDWLIRIKANR